MYRSRPAYMAALLRHFADLRTVSSVVPLARRPAESDQSQPPSTCSLEMQATIGVLHG